MIESRRNNDTLLRILALCGIVGPIIFAVLVTVSGFLYDGYSHSSQAISELAGSDAESPLLQTINFFIIGSAVMALAVGLHRGIGGGRGSVIGPALIFVFGASSGIGNGIFPFDSGCDGCDRKYLCHLTEVQGRPKLGLTLSRRQGIRICYPHCFLNVDRSL